MVDIYFIFLNKSAVSSTNVGSIIHLFRHFFPPQKLYPKGLMVGRASCEARVQCDEMCCRREGGGGKAVAGGPVGPAVKHATRCLFVSRLWASGGGGEGDGEEKKKEWAKNGKLSPYYVEKMGATPRRTSAPIAVYGKEILSRFSVEREGSTPQRTSTPIAVHDKRCGIEAEDEGLIHESSREAVKLRIQQAEERPLTADSVFRHHLGGLSAQEPFRPICRQPPPHPSP